MPGETDFEIYVTGAPMDAVGKIRDEAGRCADLRVYACGGDGTLNECVNGAAGLPNAAVTHFPCGTATTSSARSARRRRASSTSRSS